MIRPLGLLLAAFLAGAVGAAGADFDGDMGTVTGLRIEKRYAQALSALEAMAPYYADDVSRAEIGYTRGLIFEDEGRFQEALDAYSEISAAYPGAPAAGYAQLGRGRMLERLKRNEEAIDVYGNVVNLYPKFSPPALLGTGRALKDLGRLLDAAKTYRQLKDNYPNAREAAEAQTALSAICEDMLKGPLAATAFDEAAARGECLMDQDRPQEAQFLYEKALRRKPDTDTAVELLMLLARSLEVQEKYIRAERAYRRILRIVPKTPRAAEAQMRIVQRCFDRERWREAVRELSRMTRDYAGTPEAARAQYLIGTCFESMGQREKAAEAYRKVMGMGPQNPWAVQANLSLMRLMESAP